MKNLLKKYRDYLMIVGITLTIFIIIFLSKHIYPFGNNSLIYGDMYDQLTSFYYYVYDCLKGSSSLLINFGASSGVNFFGIIAYYLLSPFTLLVVLVERSKIYLFVSIIIVLKIVLCNITSLYMTKKLFKNMNSYLSAFLAMFYGFSIYSLNYYQISSWIDAMYIAPLLIVGLKKLFDEDKPLMYIITLTLSLYMSFYVTFMVIICIFLLSLFYVYNYVDKKEMSKKILSLGVSTVLAIGCSLFIIIPSYGQIAISARMGYGLETLINSKLGPIIDKMTLFLFGSILFVGIVLLLKDYKKHTKFLKMYIPMMITLLIPFFIEPVNKLLHFGSYASFPYRFGFITVLFIIIGAAYYFNSCEHKEIKLTLKKEIVSIGLAIFASLTSIAITIYKYGAFQKAVDELTFSRNKILIFLLLIMFITTFVANLIILVINKGFNKLSFVTIGIISLVHIFCTSYIYVGVEFIQSEVRDIYDSMSLMSEESEEDDYYRYKNNTNYIINNSSNVTRLQSLDHFSSLTDGQNQRTLKKLGYASYWTKTFSRGGTLFSDILLGNKYILNMGDTPYNYSLKNQYNDLHLYEYDYDMPYGYFVKQCVRLDDYDNTFDLQNAIYHSISNDREKLFETISDFSTFNIENKDNNFHILKSDNYVKFKINVKERRKIYLELYNSIDNRENEKIFKSLDIYVNGQLIEKDFPNSDINEVLDLGVFANQQVNIKIIFKNDCYLKTLKVGLLNLDKIDKFVKDNYIDYDLSFNENKINISIDSDEKKILFIPINYNDAYTLYNNGKESNIIKIYDNYIGIQLKKGHNDIRIEFTPTHLKVSLVLSIVFLIATLIIATTKLYQKLISIDKLQKMAKYAYLGIYGLVLLFIYLLPIIGFLLSWIIHIKI